MCKSVLGECYLTVNNSISIFKVNPKYLLKKWRMSVEHNSLQ